MQDNAKATLQGILEEELRRYIGSLTNHNVKDIKNVGQNTVEQTPISQPTLAAEQSQTKTESDDLSRKEKILLQLYSEFVKKDDGKALAAELGKFARFAQSEVAKASSGS